MLLTNYIRSAWRNILRHKLFSIINIMGLAIGLAAVMLIALYVRYETSYDSFWKNADNIYRVHTSYYQPSVPHASYASTTPLMKAAFDGDFPQVEYSSRAVGQEATVNYGENYFQEGVSLVDADFTRIFDFKVLSGEIEGSMDDIHNLIITKSTAARLFETTNPVGETLSIKFMAYERDYKVAAVIEDLPENTMMDINIIVPFVMEEWRDTWVLQYQWVSYGGPTYFTLKDDANIENIRTQLPAFVDRHYLAFDGYDDLETSDILKLSALNIKDVHLKANTITEPRAKGDETMINIFMLVSLLILFIASVNFTNLSTARATKRAKEVGLRKVIGASRMQLIMQFLGESVALTILSYFLACAMVEGLIPIYNNFLDLDLSFRILSNEFLLMFLVTLIVGLLGGLYPALVLSSFHPAKILKANQSTDSSASLKIRSLLVILQFSISICLFVATAVAYLQMNFVKTQDLGFDQENLLVIKAFNHSEVNEKVDILRSEIGRLPNVTAVTTSNFMPAPRSAEVRTMWTDGSETATRVKINSSYVGYDYFETYNINPIIGRTYNIERDNGEWPSYQSIKEGGNNVIPVIVNEAALRQFNLGSAQEALGKNIYQHGVVDGTLYNREFNIIGIIPDVKLQNMKTEVRAEVFFLNQKRSEVFTVRYAGAPADVLDQINRIWKREVPTIRLNYEFAEERLLNEYIKEINELSMFATFSALAIFIACLGLFGLASFTAERRTKEIGIRKVFGAEVWQIVRMLVFQFSKPVLIANIIAWPVAYIAMSRWLESFVYRIDDMVIIALCLVAGFTALLIAWATVAGNSYAVARQNPIKALRYE